MKQGQLVGLACIALALYLLWGFFNRAQGAENSELLRGRYLIEIGSCNDCHTPGFAEKGGAVPEELWLMGNQVGYQGPWGTTYASNLRLLVQRMSEQEWLAHVRRPMRPPMPWFATRALSDADAKSIYRYIRSLGPKGQLAPAYVPPGVPPRTPYLDFSPKSPASKSR